MSGARSRANDGTHSALSGRLAAGPEWRPDGGTSEYCFWEWPRLQLGNTALWDTWPIVRRFPTAPASPLTPLIDAGTPSASPFFPPSRRATSVDRHDLTTARSCALLNRSSTMKPREYCCCAIPVVYAGIYTALFEQLALGVVAGTLAIGTPSSESPGQPHFDLAH